MLKKLSIFLLFALFVQVGWSQGMQTDAASYYTRGYIYLKNGEILKAKYRFSSDLDKIVIISDGVTRVISVDEVEIITKIRPSKQKKEVKPTFSEAIYTPNKLFNITEIGWLVGNPENEIKYPFTVHTSLNYSIIPQLSAGMGIGVELYKETYLPLYTNFMYKFGNKRMQPFVNIMGGYNIPITNANMSVYDVVPYSSSFYPSYPQAEKLEAKGGFLLNPTVGFSYQISDGFSMGLSVGYRLQHLNYCTESAYTVRVGYNRLSMKICFIFN